MDASEGFTRQDQRIITEAVASRKPMVIAVNKWDLIEKDHRTTRIWEEELKDRLGMHTFIPIIFTSVLEKQRLYKLLDLATEIYEEFQTKIPTSLLNKVLLPIVKATSPPATRGKEIKINYVTQLQAAPPVFGFFTNHPKLIPDNYKRFLEKQIRLNWPFRGIPVTVAFKAKNKQASRER